MNHLMTGLVFAGAIVAILFGFLCFFVGYIKIDQWLTVREEWSESMTVKELRIEYRAYTGQCQVKGLAAVSFAQYVVDVVLPRERRDAVKPYQGINAEEYNKLRAWAAHTGYFNSNIPA
jgi:hypothetical protein